MPNEKRDHCPGSGAVPLLAGLCEHIGGKSAPFAHMSDDLFHGDRPVHLLTRSSNSVFGKMVIVKDTTLSCPGMKLLPVVSAYPIGNEIPEKSAC